MAFKRRKGSYKKKRKSSFKKKARSSSRPLRIGYRM